MSDPDTMLHRQVADRLRQQPGAVMQGITVQAQHGVVLLSGTVADSAARDAASGIAREISGVRDVCNMLTVPAAPGLQLARLTQTLPDRAPRIALGIVVGITWAWLSVLLVTATWLAALIVGVFSIVVTVVAFWNHEPPRSEGS